MQTGNYPYEDDEIGLPTHTIYTNSLRRLRNERKEQNINTYIFRNYRWMPWTVK